MHGGLGAETGLWVGVGAISHMSVCVCVSSCMASEGKHLNPFKMGYVLNIKYSSINHCRQNSSLTWGFSQLGSLNTHARAHTRTTNTSFWSFHVSSGPIKIQNLPIILSRVTVRSRCHWQVVCHIATQTSKHTRKHPHARRSAMTHKCQPSSKWLNSTKASTGLSN